jgi:hypothetical protein
MIKDEHQILWPDHFHDLQHYCGILWKNKLLITSPSSRISIWAKLAFNISKKSKILIFASLGDLNRFSLNIKNSKSFLSANVLMKFKIPGDLISSKCFGAKFVLERRITFSKNVSSIIPSPFSKKMQIFSLPLKNFKLKTKYSIKKIKEIY